MYAIQATNLTKKFDQLIALNGLDLEVETGSVTGYLGPNGSGKTTTVKLLTGLMQPTVGDSTVLDHSSSRESEKIHSLTGVLTETAECYRHLTARENLLFFGALFQIPDTKAHSRADYLLKKLDLWGARDRRAGTFSTGMKQRLSLARALMHSPQVLFLDEPTSGLDPESAVIVNRMIVDMAREEGTTALLCTHQLRYAADICTDFAILDRGVLCAAGAMDDLIAAAGAHSMAVLRVAEGVKMPEGFEQKEDVWEKEMESEAEMPVLISELVQAGIPIFEALVRRPTLEDVYFSFVKESKQEDEPDENHQ